MSETGDDNSSSFHYYDAYVRSMGEVNSEDDKRVKGEKGEEQGGTKPEEGDVQGEPQSVESEQVNQSKAAESASINLEKEISASDILGDYGDSDTRPLSVGDDEEDAGPAKLSISDYMDQIDADLKDSLRLDQKVSVEGEEEGDEEDDVHDSTISSLHELSQDTVQAEFISKARRETIPSPLPVSFSPSLRSPGAPSAPFAEGGRMSHSASSEDTDSWRGDDDDGDQYSFVPNDDRGSIINKEMTNDSTGSLSTGNFSASIHPPEDDASNSNLTDSTGQDDFRNKFMRMNTKDTLRGAMGTGNSSSVESWTSPSVNTMAEEPKEAKESVPLVVVPSPMEVMPEEEEGEGEVEGTMLTPLAENDEGHILRNSGSTASSTGRDSTRDSNTTWDSGDTKSSVQSPVSPISSSSRTGKNLENWAIPKLPTVDQKSILSLPTVSSRLKTLKEKREELLNFDTGLETFLRETVKTGSPTVLNNDGKLGPHVNAAYVNAQRGYHHYSTSVGSVTTEFASDIIRTSSVLRKKGKNFFKKIHLKSVGQL
ncbi:DEKNAAC103551 [Brettanomyces naardenensis]|uniref:DEKNAAC103551 n=1 Tax=Brettanomyces naardenensis TaxID=13370 RepID=A0A448YNL1_BRENA|nr:DEKNAAC103551 [Brettanomyces naardenensis]